MGTERNEAEKNGGHPPNSATLPFGLETISAPGRARKYASTSASSIATSHERDPPILRDEIGQGMTRLAQRGDSRTYEQPAASLPDCTPLQHLPRCAFYAKSSHFTTYRPLSSMRALGRSSNCAPKPVQAPPIARRKKTSDGAFARSVGNIPSPIGGRQA